LGKTLSSNKTPALSGVSQCHFGLARVTGFR